MKKLIFILTAFLLISSASAMSINFFYSKSCPHCQAVFPGINELASKYNQFEWIFLDVNDGSYKVNAVPTIILKTNDCREITLSGSYEIPKYLECELQEMTTKQCQTDTELNNFNSYFLR
jgi:thiol-disulfide isomerase/thioredoxin